MQRDVSPVQSEATRSPRIAGQPDLVSQFVWTKGGDFVRAAVIPDAPFYQRDPASQIAIYASTYYSLDSRYDVPEGTIGYRLLGSKQRKQGE